MPSAISPAVIQVNEDSDIVTWQPPAEPNGVIQYYNIRISHDNGTGGEELVRVVPGLMETRYDLSTLGLHAETYVIQVSLLFFYFLVVLGTYLFSTPSHRSRQSQVQELESTHRGSQSRLMVREFVCLVKFKVFIDTMYFFTLNRSGLTSHKNLSNHESPAGTIV